MRKGLLLIGFAVLLGSGCKQTNLQGKQKEEVTAADPKEVVAQDSILASTEDLEAVQISAEDFLAFLDNCDQQHAEKCGLTCLYEYEEEGEDGDAGSYAVFYGRDVEKGEKTGLGYELKPKSNHACYFEYDLDTSTHASMNFVNKADADRFFDSLLKTGLVECDGMYVVVEQKIPAGEIVHVKSMSDYDGKYSIEKPVFDAEKGVYVIQICWFA